LSLSLSLSLTGPLVPPKSCIISIILVLNGRWTFPHIKWHFGASSSYYYYYYFYAECLYTKQPLFLWHLALAALLYPKRRASSAAMWCHLTLTISLRSRGFRELKAHVLRFVLILWDVTPCSLVLPSMCIMTVSVLTAGCIETPDCTVSHLRRQRSWQPPNFPHLHVCRRVPTTRCHYVIMLYVTQRFRNISDSPWFISCIGSVIVIANSCKESCSVSAEMLQHFHCSL
jgi:hypothetical protein